MNDLPLSWHDVPPPQSEADYGLGISVFEGLGQIADTSSSRYLRAIPLTEIEARIDGRYIAKGIVPASGFVVVVGQPSCGKSFAMSDLALHVAAGAPWLGYRVQRTPVLYVAAEGGNGMTSRIAAWRREHRPMERDARFWLVNAPLNFADGRADLDWLIDEAHRLDVGLIVIDTLSRTMPGTEENSPEAMTRFVAQMDRLRTETGAAVLVIHHEGKDPKKGPRGHSSLAAAADVIVAITREPQTKISTATVTKSRDGEAGISFSFALRSVELGRDDDGDPVNSAVVIAAEAARAFSAKLSLPARQALDALKELLVREGGVPPASPETPADKPGVSKELWKEHALCMDAFRAKKPETQDREFRRAIQELKRGGYIATAGLHAWIVAD
jgi:hypothetical protein